MKITLLALCAAASLCLAAPLAQAQATIKLISLDGPNVGLNDPTPVAPAGGNPGKTLGQQRMITYQYAMDLWGALLTSTPKIGVEATFGPLVCQAGLIYLGAASTTYEIPEDKVVPGGKPDYYYPVAMANSLAGRDLAPLANEISASFNSNIDDPACQAFGVNGWFYGLRGNAMDNPGFRSNFLNVVMHELGHGLGFSGISTIGYHFRDVPWDGLVWSNDYSMVYNDFDFSDPRLATAITSPGRNVWLGEKANRTAAMLAENRSYLKISAPQPALYEYVTTAYSAQDTGAMKGEIVLVDDALTSNGLAEHTGCDGAGGLPLIINGDALKGKLALVDAGGCRIGQKALGAQNHGAIGVIVANTVPQDALRAGSSSFLPGIKVPVITVTQEVGAALRTNGPAVAAGFVVDKNQFYGLDSNRRLRVFTPKSYLPGSSFSHLDVDMTPDFIMEAYEGRGTRADVLIDVSLDMLEEMGWKTNRNGTAKFGDCDTTIPVYRDAFIPGANLIAHNNMCRTAHAGNRSLQLRCINDQISWLQSQSLITPLEVAKARQCAARL